MPAYSFECQSCHMISDVIASIGTAPRTRPCSTCGGVMLLRIGAGVQIAVSGFETKGGDVREVDATEARWDKDMPAYKRMRNKGMQPRNIDGSAALEEQVGSQFDVQYKPLLDRGITRERIREGQEQAKELVESSDIPWHGESV